MQPKAPKKILYTVDLYVGKNIVSSITVSAKDKKDAVQLAVKETRIQVRKMKQPEKFKK